jgi:phage shock protein B
MEETLVPIALFATLFVGMPWLFLHYTTKWKQGKSLTVEDENLLDELYDTARRLEDRLITIERIMAADNPNWKSNV